MGRGIYIKNARVYLRARGEDIRIHRRKFNRVERTSSPLILPRESHTQLCWLKHSQGSKEQRSESVFFERKIQEGRRTWDETRNETHDLNASSTPSSTFSTQTSPEWTRAFPMISRALERCCSERSRRGRPEGVEREGVL